VLTATNQVGGTRTLTYNADGTIDTDTAPSGDKTTYGYDAQTRIDGHYADASAQFTYDARDRLMRRSMSAASRRPRTPTMASCRRHGP
jgi:YD repeat-containing protein